MDEHRQRVATNGARAKSTSEQGWGKDACVTDPEVCRDAAAFIKWVDTVVLGTKLGMHK